MRRAAGGRWIPSSNKASERNAELGPGLEAEAELFRRAGARGIPGPAVIEELKADDGLGSGFLMTWLDGETLGHKIAQAEDFAEIRPTLAQQCGEILAQIHQMEWAGTALESHLEVLDPKTFVERQWAWYRSFGSPQPMIDYTARWLLENLPPTTPYTLVHNDFRNGNLMIDRNVGIIGVLDWEVAHIGDPMRDLGWLCTPSWRFGRADLPVGGFGSREALYAAYTRAGGRSIDPSHVFFWEVFGSFWWAIGCLSMAQHYRSGPDRSVERPAIGRRSSECQIDCVNLLIPGPVTELSPPDPASEEDSLPTTLELVESVRKYLREDVTTQTEGRPRFYARVAANTLDIVEREIRVGDKQRTDELTRLRRLLGTHGSLTHLRQNLVEKIRSNEFELEDEALTHHLRETTYARVMIDQPHYPGARYARDAQRPP